MPTWVSNTPSTPTNAFRLRATTTQSPSSVGSGTSSVQIRLRIWLETRRAMYASSSGNFTVSGSWPSRSGSVSFNHPNNSSDWPSNNVTLIYDETITVSTSTAGSVSRSFSASIGGLPAVGGTASLSESHSVPRRPSPAPVVPSAPTGISLTGTGADRVTATFAPPTSTGGATIINHQFQFATDSAFNNQVAAPQFTGSRSYTQTGLSPNTRYWVRARVQNSVGWGAWSASVSFTTSVDIPNAVSGLSASRVNNGDSAHLVSWSNNHMSSAPYETLRVQRRHILSDGSWSAWSTAADVSNTSSYQGATEPNRRYQWRVRAQNRAGVSQWRTTQVLDNTPAAPSGVVAGPSSSSISVSWTNVAGFPLLRFDVQRQSDGGAWSASSPSGGSPFVHGSPDQAQTHRYRVRAVAASGLVSAWSYSNTVQLASPPSAPTSLGPSGAWDATEDHTWTWRHVPTDGSDQERFRVRHRILGTSGWTYSDSVTSPVSAWTLPAGSYSNGDAVEWQVLTWGSHPDPSPWSASQVTTPVARPTASINAPDDGAVIGTSSVRVEWEYYQEQGSPQSRWEASLRDLDTGEVLSYETGTSESHVVFQVATDRAYRVLLDVWSGEGLRRAGESVTFSVDFLPPAMPGITVSWDVELGAAVIGIEQPEWDQETTAEPSHHQVWRAIGDGPWLMIADEVPLGASVTDPVPAIGDGAVNHYKATTVSVLPSTADSPQWPLAVTTRMTRGWVYLNAGPGMATVCRVRANATRSGTRGRARTLRQFAGRSRPVAFSGTVRSNEWDVAARVAPDFDGASTDDELVALQDEYGDLVCYRDPTGKRWYGAMGPVGDSVHSIIGEVSFSMTEVDHREGLAVQQHAPDGDEEPVA